MRTFLLAFCLVLLGQLDAHAQVDKTNMDSVSYSLGVLVAQNLKSQGFDEINTDELAAAISDVLNDRPTKVDVQQANMMVQQYMQEKAASKHKVNKEAGEQFLAENGQREGVTTTASGLQYEVITEGSGRKPSATDEVTVHYHGTLIDGTVFDSSVERGEPTSFPLNRVISGWTEGVQLMSEGSKYRFFIPYNLAYGEREAGAKIKPFSALIFEVELINIK